MSSVSAVIDAIRSWSGIVVPGYRVGLVESELARLGGGSAASGAELVLGGDEAARRALFAVVTIPETYFFRNPEHFVTLAAAARSRAASGRPCHVLSAGASTGEEAWSAAAVLATTYLRNGPAHSVTGIEIDANRVRHAAAGSYSKWSTRQGFCGYEAFFVADGSRYRIHDSLRPIVRFIEGNLGDPVLPPEARLDVIFFRNVAIYWEESRYRRVLSTLARHLTDDGLLILGPSDPAPLPSHEWLALPRLGPRVFARAGAQCEQRASDKPPTRVQPLRQAPRAPVEEPVAAPEPVAPAAPLAVVCTPPVEEALARAEARADAGDYQGVLEIVRALAGDPLPRAKLWEGIALFNLERSDAALQAFRQCVFLAPEEPQYRHWLALALESTGRAGDAQRERRNALELEASHG